MTDGQHRTSTETPEGPQPPGGVIAQAPTALIVTVGAMFIAILAALVVIILAGKSTQELTDALKLIFGAVSSIGALGGTLYAASAAKSSKAAREQTDGSLDRRIEQHVAKGIAAAFGRPTPPAAPRAARPRPRGDTNKAA